MEGIKLNEVSQAEKNTVYFHWYVDSQKWKKWLNIIKQKQTHRYRKQAIGYQWEEGLEEGQNRGRIKKYKLLCIR